MTLAVHPRERGERSTTAALLSGADGSSPRARGTGPHDHRIGAGRRFIPASAGNGPSVQASASLSAVHPRERGERLRAAFRTIDHDGSSPRARGTVQIVGDMKCGARFIPASAGNGAGQYLLSLFVPVHPRERGERTPWTPRKCIRVGSSPRARGTGHARRNGPVSGRFIPASAGNGSLVSPEYSHSAVHPRERGERAISSAPGQSIAGSSPRARGTVSTPRLALVVLRFIPASAGNGTVCAPQPAFSTVHPRERGERIASSRPAFTGCGSSPRARGTGRRTPALQRRSRFIPASAGNGRRMPP